MTPDNKAVTPATDEQISLIALNPSIVSEQEVRSLISRVEQLISENKRLRECVEDMTWQFASRGKIGGVDNINTMGLSSLENAFAILGWEDPRPMGEV